MRKEYKYIIGIIAMFLLSAILFSFTTKKKVPAKQTTSTDKKNILPVAPKIEPEKTEQNLGTKENPAFPIKRGSRGAHVTELQRGLNHQYFYVRKLKKLQPLELDGQFGNLTETMLKDLYNVTQVDKELAKKMYKDNGIVIMPEWIDRLH